MLQNFSTNLQLTQSRYDRVWDVAVGIKPDHQQRQNNQSTSQGKIIVWKVDKKDFKKIALKWQEMLVF